MATHGTFNFLTQRTQVDFLESMQEYKVVSSVMIVITISPKLRAVYKHIIYINLFKNSVRKLKMLKINMN